MSFPPKATTSKDTAETETPRAIGRSAQEGQLGDRVTALKLQMEKDMHEAMLSAMNTPGGRNRSVPLAAVGLAGQAQGMCFR